MFHERRECKLFVKGSNLQRDRDICIVERIRYYDYVTDENSRDQSVAKIQNERENSAIFPRP